MDDDHNAVAVMENMQFFLRKSRKNPFDERLKTPEGNFCWIKFYLRFRLFCSVGKFEFETFCICSIIKQYQRLWKDANGQQSSSSSLLCICQDIHFAFNLSFLAHSSVTFKLFTANFPLLYHSQFASSFFIHEAEKFPPNIFTRKSQDAMINVIWR